MTVYIFLDDSDVFVKKVIRTWLPNVSDILRQAQCSPLDGPRSCHLHLFVCIKNQRGKGPECVKKIFQSANGTFNRGHFTCLELVLYGIKEQFSNIMISNNQSGELWPGRATTFPDCGTLGSILSLLSSRANKVWAMRRSTSPGGINPCLFKVRS